jgi:pimeloyl-ACP methyl ester carboxylesterase
MIMTRTQTLVAGGILSAATATAALSFVNASEPRAIAMTANPTTRYLDRPEGRIAYDDRGSGPLVVLVPGLGDVRGEYRFLTPQLVAAGYRVVTMDVRGHGESTVGWSDYSTSGIGSDVVALVRELDAGPATVIGTSMGAGAAAWAAAEAPDAIAGLVLVGPFVRNVPMPWWKMAMFRAVMNTAFVGPWGPAAWGMYYASLYPTAKPADFDAYKAGLVANLKEPGRMAALQAMLAMDKSDVESRLGAVRARTLVVMGTKDPDFPDPKVEADIVAGLLKGTALMVEGAGHYPHAEMPEAVAPAVIDFLGRGNNAALGS